MPKYVYFCDNCEEEFEIRHGMREKYNHCILCDEKNFIHRIPQITKVTHKNKIGNKVKDSIEENRKILKDMKKEVKKDYG